MSSRHPAARGRKDKNQREIVRAFEWAGWRVLDLSGVGGGCPDLLVCPPSSAEMLFVEVKTPVGKMRESQLKFGAVWPVAVARSVDDVVRLIGGR